MTAFIETQFPIARLSAESYKERKANNGQTLTRLGKWWGRKPLILVRAAILGMLMPASADAKKDREVFLQILTMDDDGAWQRCKPPAQRKLGRAAFDALTYAERIALCNRPENVAGPDAKAWGEINAHLGTTAANLPELVEQLGQRSFGHRPRVGDSFCGGGSIPFEAARIGCDAFGSDLNPVAGLLTWASLNLLGGGPEVRQEVTRVQAAALMAADEQVTAWGIEHNGRGERADAYLYCVEVKPEGCDYYIPLAGIWLVAEKTRAVCRWPRVPGSDRLRPEVVVVDEAEVKRYKDKKGATVVDGRVVDPFDPARTWSIEALRGPDGLRRWTNDDLVPRPGDVFQERLDKLSPAIKRVKLQNEVLPGYGEQFNPLLRCIVRRTRGYLEAMVNPATGDYFLPKVTVRLFGEDAASALGLGGCLRDAYEEAENFSRLLQQRVRGAGFFKTLLLRRLGSSMEAGRNTVMRLLSAAPDEPTDEDDDDSDDSVGADGGGDDAQGHRAIASSDFKDFTKAEVASLNRCLALLRQGGNNDPKLDAVLGCLLGTGSAVSERWMARGCILFSQYYDTVRWVGDELAKRAEFAGLEIGLYAGSNRSGIWSAGRFQRCDREVLKARVRSGELKLLLGTDAASEGLNLQRLGTLINIDLPWNPTRLEQRKGRIQRIGQVRSEVWIANQRYRGSVEDRVHQVLADRLESIHQLFGQIPDTLEDVWVKIALEGEQEARQLIDRSTATRNPFDAKYSRVEDADWETSSLVLAPQAVKEQLSRGW